jgi:RES domain-containing protein
LRAWRLARRRYAGLDGAGARRLGGRWNARGQPAVYASEHLSLAVLEIIVHLELSPGEFPQDYVKIAIDIPDTIAIHRVVKLPKKDAEMRELGSRWIASQSTAVLMVPSVVVPEEFNLLLNPRHPEFHRVSAAAPQPFRFDPRLLTGYP